MHYLPILFIDQLSNRVKDLMVSQPPPRPPTPAQLTHCGWAGPTRDEHGALDSCSSPEWLWPWLHGGPGVWCGGPACSRVSGAEPASSRLAPSHLLPLGWAGLTAAVTADT